MPLLPITNKCNQRCLFCSAAGRPDQVSLPHILRMISSFRGSGGGTVTLSGGETTLSPHLRGAASRALARGMTLELQTNALTCAYPGRARALVSLGVSLFNVNFPSHLAAVNDRLTGTSGTLPLRVRGVKNLLAGGARVRLTHLVTTLNYRKLPEFAMFAARNFPGLAHVQFSFVKLQGLASENGWLLPEYAAAAPFLRRALAACSRRGLKAVVDHIPPCFLGPYAGLHADYAKLSGGMEAAESRAEKKKLPACSGCAIGRFCPGTRRDHAAVLKGRPLVKPLKRRPAA